MVCIQETKMAVISDRVVRDCLGPSFDKFFFLPAVGTRGGILLAWQSALVSVSHLHLSTNAITARISIGTDQSWWFTGVYGPRGMWINVPSSRSCRIFAICMWGLG
jgi:hypothetical protein